MKEAFHKMKLRKKSFLFLVLILSSGLLVLTACSCSGSSSGKKTDTKVETIIETETKSETEKKTETGSGSGAKTTIEEATIPEIPVEEKAPGIAPADSSGKTEPEETNEDPEEVSTDEHYELPEISLDD